MTDKEANTMTNHTKSPTVAPKHVYVLTWGGGDEPESPAISLHRTKGGALRQARSWVSELGVTDERGLPSRVLRELRASGSAWEMPNETWMTLERLSVGA
jgi:hypothetical protein